MSFKFSPKIVTDGLVLYLDAANTKSYPKTGTTWTDLSRAGSIGTLDGPTFSGNSNGIIVFDGVNDYVNVSSSSSVFSSNFSVSLWYYPLTNSGGYRILFETNGYRNGTLGFAIYQFDNYFRIWQRTGPSTYLELITTSSNTVGLNAWKNFVLTRNGGVFTFYVDNVVRGTYSTDNNNYQNIRYNLGGTGPSVENFWFLGGIAINQIYDRALSQLEIQQNYNTLKSRFGL